METYKILSLVDQLTDAYKTPINIVDGLTFDHPDTIRTIEFYSNDKYTTGNRDGLNREKPFFNVCNFRVTVAKTATDIDVKDIRYEPDNLTQETSTATMLINHELFKFLKATNFSETLNDMGKTRPKYGGVLIKKYDNNGKIKINVVEWKNVSVDPCDILNSPIVETHYMQPSELIDKEDVWYGYDSIEDVLKAQAKANKNKPGRIEIKEITGQFPKSLNPNEKNTIENDQVYQDMCFYLACVNKKKFLLYFVEGEKAKDKYKYLAWEKVPGRDLGRGVVEEGFEAQVWTNDGVISLKNIMDLAGKTFITTTSKKISGNALTGVDTGHIFELEPNATIQTLNLAPNSIPELRNMIEMWNQQYNNSVSVHDANTGEAPTAGTPYSQTALLNQVANSPFEYQREVWGIFLNEVLNDWILPYLKKEISKEHYLVDDFNEEEIAMIDEAIYGDHKKEISKQILLEGETVNPQDEINMRQSVTDAMKSFGTKRQVLVPKKFLDVEGQITANITGELRNKQSILQSLDLVMQRIISTFDPNTGKFAALEDPVLSKILGTVIDTAGIPISFAELKYRADQMHSNVPTSPVPAPDLSAISPQNVQPTGAIA